mgnify:CR=1 FL=1
MTSGGARVALVAYADGPSAPRISPATALAAAGLADRRPEVLLGLTVERHPWLDDADLRGTTVLAGYTLLLGADHAVRRRYLPAIAAGTLTATVAGFDAPAARPFLGRLHVLDIGAPRELTFSLRPLPPYWPSCLKC